MLVEHTVVCPVLIGRDTPLAVVFRSLGRAHESHGETVLIGGEAGIGKSRLVRAMVERARSEGFVTLQGACFEADRAQPYAPLLDLVRVLATTSSPALAAHYFAPAAQELVTLFPELRSIFPGAEPRRAFDPEEDRRRLFHSFTEAVYAVGRVQPLLLVIEDVHWSDDATLDLVLHLARRIGTQPIALALTLRSDERGPRLERLLADLDRARCVSEIELARLEQPQVSAMLRAIFGAHSALGASFVDGLHGLTEGNPFFVEEVLKALVMDGDVAQVDGTWRARPLEHVRVPRTAAEAVSRRLEGLSVAARQVASVAAVAGRRFDFRLLQALTQHDETALLALVKELMAAQLVVEESADRFAFRHALTRETIRGRLLARERVALHREIAAALEREIGDDNPEAQEALAYHAFEAGAWELARGSARRAAAHAIRLSAPREALQQLDRAVVATEKLGLGPDAPLLLDRGRAHETLGAFPQANLNFTSALDAARAGGDRRSEWAALYSLGMLWAARDYERAGRYRRDALDVARALDDPRLVARSLNRIGNWYVNREDPQSGTPYHEEALAIFERANDLAGVAETTDLLAMAQHIAGDMQAAVTLYERSIAIFTDIDDKRGLANALAVLSGCGPSHHASGVPVPIIVESGAPLPGERAIRLSADIGWRAGEAFSRWIVADCLAWRGEYERALRAARESLAIAQEMEHLEWECGARRVLGVIALDLCAPAEALPELETAHDIARRLASATWIRWTGAYVAIALARAGQPGRGTALLEEIERAVPTGSGSDAGQARARQTLGTRLLTLARAEVAIAIGDPAQALAVIDEREARHTPRAALLRARAWAAMGSWPETSEWLDAARREAARQDARSLQWRIYALEGAAHLAQRRRAEARRSFDSARLAAEGLGVGLHEAALVAAFRAGVDRLAPPPPRRTSRQAAKAAHGGLTRRERDTAALIAQGKSNRAIARLLGIGERTVEGYVGAALSKLGFSSRSQIAVWAAEQKLPGTEAGRGGNRT